MYLNIEAIVLDESDEQCRVPPIPSLQSEAVCLAALLIRQSSHLNCSVHCVLSHGAIGGPLAWEGGEREGSGEEVKR